MDKYEYKEKTEKMLGLMEKGAYKKAAEIADTIDWKKVRNTSILFRVSDIYEVLRDYGRSYEILKIAYHHSADSRKITERLCTLALKSGNVDEAIDFYDEFVKIAPKDPNQYILKYKILKARRAPIEQQIEALVEFKKSEYIEEWAYELAKKYQEAGMTAECLDECDDLILWFSEGKYVYKAMELKMQYKPLTPSQQEKYDHRFGKKTEDATEEIPDIIEYQEKKQKEQEQQEPEQNMDFTEELDKVTADEPEECEDEGLKKLNEKGIVKTMKLQEAIQSLLHPEENADENANEQGEIEEESPEYKEAIEKIEAVADLDIASMREEKSDNSDQDSAVLDKDLEELTVDPIEEEFIQKENAVLDGEIDETVEIPEISDQRDEEPLDENFHEEIKPVEELPKEEVDMADNKEKVTTVLPSDIQKMIDEIEGLIPSEPELEPESESESLPQEEEPLEDYEEEEFIDEPEDEIVDESEEKEFEEESEQEFADEQEEEILDDYEEEEESLEDYEEESLDDYEEEDFLEDYEEEETEALDESEEEAEEEPIEEQSDSGKLDDWDYEDMEATLEEEFRPNPENTKEPDEREIPDEEDGLDILSATTPLSRKQTAKLHATGKTAPIPVGEISDAMSMSNTGFVVHGRYDLEVQSGIGTRAGLTDEQKKLFSYFVPVRGMSGQLVEVLEHDHNCTNRGGTSRTGNLLVIGNKGNGKTVLAVDMVKAIQKQRNIHQGKVAIVTGESLNKKKIDDIFEKLYGGALIIEKASKMNEKTVSRLNKAMERDTGELFVVLEEERKPLDRLLSTNKEFRRKFTCRIEIPIFINDELVTFGQTYAKENGYRIDEMGILALYSRIDSLQREDHAVTVSEAKEIMDKAIAHSQKASAKKLVKKVLGRNTDESDRIFLSEKDFNA